MKRSEIQTKVKESLRSLNIIGITPEALRQAKAEIEGVSPEGIPSQGVPLKGIPPEGTPLSEVEIKRNFCKVDIGVLDRAICTMDVYEQSVYIRLYRLSYGYGKNYCTVGYSSLMKSCNLKRNGITNALKRLAEKGWILAVGFDRSKGTTYRIFLPDELDPTGMPLKGIPLKGTPLKDIPTVTPEGIPPKDTPQRKPVPTQASNPGIPPEGIPLKAPIIEDHNIDHTLSIILYFYKRIGHDKISKEKRERAKKVVEELLQDGFSIDDIQFAATWSVENAKEKPYDFSILKHTIGQAVAVKKKQNAKKKAVAGERERERRRKEKEATIKEYKGSLSPEERQKLREQAEASIRNSGQFKAEFVTEALVAAKENEIIASRKTRYNS